MELLVARTIAIILAITTLVVCGLFAPRSGRWVFLIIMGGMLAGLAASTGLVMLVHHFRPQALPEPWETVFTIVWPAGAAVGSLVASIGLAFSLARKSKGR